MSSSRVKCSAAAHNRKITCYCAEHHENLMKCVRRQVYGKTCHPKIKCQCFESDDKEIKVPWELLRSICIFVHPCCKLRVKDKLCSKCQKEFVFAAFHYSCGRLACWSNDTDLCIFCYIVKKYNIVYGWP